MELLDTATRDAVLMSLQRMRLIDAGADVQLTPLTGGVSSLILRVDHQGQRFCVKRSLPQLKVAAVWKAPVERNRAEVDWLRLAAQACPHAVPAILGQDREGCAFAMGYLEPESYPVWKSSLRDGQVRLQDAQSVGHTLARIHAHAARQPGLADRFANDDDFYALRLEPYFAASALRHPDRAEALHRLITTTQQTRHTLMHGDISPKNILLGPQGPVLLDAECACWGDAAFDLAFVLNHLLLKTVWRPIYTDDYLRAFQGLAQTYLSQVSWENASTLERRTADLIAGMLLARVDGKSPAEYITQADDQERVRRCARDLLQQPALTLTELQQRWMTR
jgi:5-methylthioribose kinase